MKHSITRLSISLLVVSLAVAAAYCGESAPPAEELPNTRIIELEDRRAVIDWTTMEEHRDMMAMMNIDDMPHGENSDTVIVVTLIDQNDGSMITDANVTLTIQTPDAQTLSPETQVMEGGNMHHYTADFEQSGSGTYKIDAKIKIGDEELEASTEFDRD